MSFFSPFGVVLTNSGLESADSADFLFFASSFFFFFPSPGWPHCGFSFFFLPLFLASFLS